MTQTGDTKLAGDVLEALHKRQPRAAFITEVAASIRPAPPKDDMETVLRELGREGRVLVIDYASPDPHLDRNDLRVVASVPERDESAAWKQPRLTGTTGCEPSCAPTVANSIYVRTIVTSRTPASTRKRRIA